MKVKDYPQLESLFRFKYYNFAYRVDTGMYRLVTVNKDDLLNAEVVDYCFFEEFYFLKINILYSGIHQKFIRIGRRY